MTTVLLCPSCQKGLAHLTPLTNSSAPYPARVRAALLEAGRVFCAYNHHRQKEEDR